MYIDTPNLIIQPLTVKQLEKYILCDFSLEKELAVEKKPRVITPELKEAITTVILPCTIKNSPNYLFNTLWTVISKEHNTMVGDLTFYGGPNEEGKVEIGYGTYPDFTGKGFMTEAVHVLVQWAHLQHNVQTVIANTDRDNIASMRILEKNDFKRSAETDTQYIWEHSNSCLKHHSFPLPG